MPPYFRHLCLQAFTLIPCLVRNICSFCQNLFCGRSSHNGNNYKMAFQRLWNLEKWDWNVRGTTHCELVLATFCCTTKTCVVFDALAKCNGVSSLNDMIYQGPTLQRNYLFTYFQRYPVALVCEIYLRIKLYSADRSCHRFLW